MAAGRYVADLPFPDGAYVPGRSPHPGHVLSERLARETQDERPPTLRGNRVYLYGLDLFHAGYYWEAHEAWELLWQRAGRRGPLADFLKGLIKLAAAGVKAREGRPAGIRTHATRAATLFQEVRRSLEPVVEQFGGLDVRTLISHARQLAADPDRWLSTSETGTSETGTSETGAVAVFPWRLELAVDFLA